MEDDKLKAYKEMGINRISLGVQDFDEKVMKTINRVQPYDVVRDCVDRMREAGINSLNMDFIYGLPYQTMATTEDTMEKALEIGPDRLALFGYAHVPWMKKHMRLIKDETLPDKSLRYDLFEKAAQMLEGAEFDAIGIDHFAKGTDSMAVQTRAGKLRRNFQGYTTDAADALIGFGVSSIGELPNGYVQNLSHNILYRDVLEKNLIPIYRGYELTQVDKLHKAAIEQLMCHFRLDVGGICKAYGFDEGAADNCFDYLSDLVGDDLVKIDGRVVTINPEARQIARIAAAAFDAYLHQGPGRHSQAV
jgi:oxygen-independent coproporphyrinogen-3 oxidase